MIPLLRQYKQSQMTHYRSSGEQFSTDHLVNNLDFFTTIEDMATPSKITTAKRGKYIMATKRGKMELISNLGVPCNTRKCVVHTGHPTKHALRSTNAKQRIDHYIRER